MPDQFYAVQYRNMHTAIHHVAVFSNKHPALEFLFCIESDEQLPDQELYDFSEDDDFIAVNEIDYRNPPTHNAEGERLIYVNAVNTYTTSTFKGTERTSSVTVVPDVY